MYASFSHTLYWYEVGMLKVSAKLYADDAYIVSRSPQGLVEMMEVIVQV